MTIDTVFCPLLKGEETGALYPRINRELVFGSASFTVGRVVVEGEAQGQELLSVQLLPETIVKTPEGSITFTGAAYGVAAPIGVSAGGVREEVRYGPSGGSYTFVCEGWASVDACKGCCMTLSAAAFGALVKFGIWCHGLTCWFCPPCHIGCGVTEGLTAAWIAWVTSLCLANCEIPYTVQYPIT
jgi:hypothetical protein